MSKSFSCFLIAAACVLLPRVSPASPTGVVPESRSESASSWERLPFALELRVGIATPVGGAGAGVDFTPIEPLSFACGVGTNPLGPEVECGLRLRHIFKSGTQAIYVGGGASGGPHEQGLVSRLGALGVVLAPMTAMGHSSYSADYSFDIAYWANVELGYESRSRSGFAFRVYAGTGNLLNRDDAVATDPPGEWDTVLEPATVLPYVGVAFGKAI